MDVFDGACGQWIDINPEDGNSHHTADVTTFADWWLGQTNEVTDHGRFYSAADLARQSRPVEDAASSRLMQELFSHTDFATFPSESTLRWPHDGLMTEPQQSPSTVDPRNLVLWPPASYLFNGDQTAAQHRSQANIEMPVPSPAGSPSLQGSPPVSSDAYTPYDLHLSLPPTPASSTSVSTPASSATSTRTSPERSSVATPLPRKKRPCSVPYARPTASAQRSIQRSFMDPTDAVARDIIRKGVQQFVTDHPHVIEPFIGDQAAMDIVGSNPSGSGRKLRFNCHDCGHVDARASRALRHQRQFHFGHNPFPCQGGAGHSVCGQWFSSEEYAADHVTKAGSTTFPCPECSKVFCNVGNLGRHQKKIHHASQPGLVVAQDAQLLCENTAVLVFTNTHVSTASALGVTP